jgi:peptidoglycan hydrolase-like protein with peptidoglycan-binding domain
MNRKSCLLAAVFSFALASLALADKAVEAAQQKLKDQGFYYGEITGSKDADTTAAIRRYQIRNGLQITGELNSETLGSLGVASKPAATPAPRPKQTPTPGPTPPGFLEDAQAPTATPAPRQPAPPPNYDQGPDPDVQPNAPPVEPRTPFAKTPYQNAPPAVQQDIVMQAQIRLMRQGYYRDQVDGLYGPAMNFALRGFQARFGLQPSGQLDVETLAALGLLPEQRLSRYPHPRRHFFPPWARRGPGGERIYIPR